LPSRSGFRPEHCRHRPRRADRARSCRGRPPDRAAIKLPVTERSVKTRLNPDLLSRYPLATLKRITVTLALAVADHLDEADRAGRAKFSQQDLDNGLISVVRLFLKDNLAILKPRLQPQPVPEGFDLYQFLHLIFPSMLLGKTDAAAAEMLSMSQSQVTRIKNGRLSITRITAQSLAQSIEGAWHRMMDETPATLGDDWAETNEGDWHRMMNEKPATLGDDWAEMPYPA
jgi:hypothetical protein